MKKTNSKALQKKKGASVFRQDFDPVEAKRAALAVFDSSLNNYHRETDSNQWKKASVVKSLRRKWGNAF